MVSAVSSAELKKVWLNFASFQARAKLSQRIASGSDSGFWTICGAPASAS